MWLSKKMRKSCWISINKRVNCNLKGNVDKAAFGYWHMESCINHCDRAHANMLNS